ncbi:MAG TPA: dual specificity protein phosphatase family protein [Anaerolineales bacterium]|nr:dual specificity protein phosphatase family protein [Anaerolineales bacterium]
MKNLPISESYWVKENVFLAGEYPASYDAETTRRRLEAFIEAGIRSFIDLTQPHELPSYEAVLKDLSHIYDYKLSYQRFAIRDHGIPSSQTMTEILDAIDDSIQNGDPVYVHCWGGVGRTGTVVGCHLIRKGMQPEDALLRVASLYQTRVKTQAYFLPTSPETPEQFEFVRNWWEEPSSDRRPRYCEG